WSRDARYLMFAGAPQGDGASRIFVVDPQGRQVSSFAGWLPSWSPDSSSVAAWDDPSTTVGTWSVDGRRPSTVPFPTGGTTPGASSRIWQPAASTTPFGRNSTTESPSHGLVSLNANRWR